METRKRKDWDVEVRSIDDLIEKERAIRDSRKTCRSCANRERHQYGGSVIQYCGARKDNRTFNWLKKIRCNMQACLQYKEKQEPC